MPKPRKYFRSGRRPSTDGTPLLQVQRSWLYIAIAGLALAVLLGNKGFRTIVRSTFLLRDIRGDIVSESAAERDLQKKITAVATDDDALEHAARRELGYLKSGEVEYRFPPPDKARR